MSVPELLPGVHVDLPLGQEPHGVAVFAHGLGDLADGPMAQALARALPLQGIAVMRVPLAERVDSNDVVPFSLSEQSERISSTLEVAADQYPRVHAVGHSLGSLPIAEGVLDSALSRVSVALLAPPPTNGRQRLEAEIAAGMNSGTFAGRDLAGIVPLPRIDRRIGLTPQFWEEIRDFQPLPLIRGVFTEHPTTIMVAGADERFGKDNEHFGQLPASATSSVEVVPGANHHFSRHRRDVAARLAALMRSERAA